MSTSFELPAESRLVQSTLRVRDLEAQLGFYRDLLGLRVREDDEGQVRLGPDGAEMTLALTADPEAPRRPHPSVGLYHQAFLVPDRQALASVLEGLIDQGAKLQGAADHGVSEAIYLADPEGNEVEIYRDREPEAWPRQGDEVAMVTHALDLEDVLAESQGSSGLHARTRLGHVHLHVPDLEPAGAFYQALGLTVSQSTYPGALFLAAGGYHHHVGLNTWAGRRMAPDGATGLASYAWAVPGHALDDLLQAPLEELERVDGEVRVVDPAGITVRFTRA